MGRLLAQVGDALLTADQDVEEGQDLLPVAEDFHMALAREGFAPPVFFPPPQGFAGDGDVAPQLAGGMAAQ